MFFMRQSPTIRIKVCLAIAAFLSCLLPVFAINSQTGTSFVIRPPANSSDAVIQRALDQLPADGGSVLLSPGVYVIHHPLVLSRSGMALRGSGAVTVLQLADRANCPVIILGSISGSTTSIVHNLCVSDLVIDGNRSHQMMEQWLNPLNTSGIENNGIIIQCVSNSMVERVVAAHCRSGGLVTAVETRNLTVEDFTSFDNQFDGLACYKTEDSVFTKLNLHDNQCAGISLDLDFNHNVISDSTLAGNDLGIFMRESFSNQFHNLSISQSRHDGVFMAQWVQSEAKGWEYIPQTECAGNQFDGLQIHGCAGDAFCIHDPSCIRNVVEDERFSGNLTNGVVEGNTKPAHLLGLLTSKN